MNNEEIISNFLRTAYTDERLAALLAHAEDEKLSWHSCCCLLGVPTADHALQGAMTGGVQVDHYKAARVKYGLEADRAFMSLSGASPYEKADAERRARLIPLIRAEFERRQCLREQKQSEPKENRNESGSGITSGNAKGFVPAADAAPLSRA